MFPVSGAAQLNTSGARNGLRPMISQSGAYWRLVRPAPCSRSGRNRFHRPSALAFAFSSSMIGGVAQGFSWASTCWEKISSLGRMWVSKKSSTRARSCSVVVS